MHAGGDLLSRPTLVLYAGPDTAPYVLEMRQR